MIEAVSTFLKQLNIPVSIAYVEKLIHNHPDFPSLLSISDTLQRLGIDHVARRVNKEGLTELAFPYLLPIDNGQGDMLLIKSERDLDKYKTDLQFWGGIVLHVEPTSQITDKVNNELYSKESRIRNLSIGLGFFVALFILFSLAHSFSWILLTLLTTSIVGVAVGYLLIAKELGVTYKAIDAFCNAGKNTNCDKILKTDIHLFGMNFSDAVATYFLFQLVSLGFAQAVPAIKEIFLQAMAILSISTLPIVLFSLYYQYAIAKTWCRLCLVVVFVLLIQFFIFSFGYFNGAIQLVKMPLVPMAMLVLLFATTGFTLLMVKSIIERLTKLSQLAGNGNRVKHLSAVFIHLLRQQKKVNTQPFDEEILIGEPNSPIKIIMVSNLYCNPCKDKHEILEQLVATYPNQVSVAIRFVKSGKDATSLSAVSYLLGYWLSQVFGKTDESSKMETLLHHWFLIPDLEKFGMKYPTEQVDDEKVRRLEKQHYAWAEEIGVMGTPTFFVNGYQLPKEYAIDDLMAMVPALASTLEDSNNI